ncbi:MAG: FHA domain-containing protein [Lachnospiraceae bacterium]|nr:FHA domain-containing protein [Lachnospiraceae bacterium]
MRKIYKLVCMSIVALLIMIVATVFNYEITFATETEEGDMPASSMDAASETDAGSTDIYGTEQRTDYIYDVEQSIVEVRVIYGDDLDDEYIIKGGNGFFIGHSDSQVYIVCGRESLVPTSEEKEQVVSTFLLEDNKFATVIQFKIEPDVFCEAKVIADSEKLGIMILEPVQKVGTVTTLELDKDGYSNKIDDFIRVLSKEDGSDSYSEEGIIVDWCTIDGIHYYVHDVAVGKWNYGCPLVDEENKVIGVNILSDGTKSYAVQVEDIIGLCQELGIDYNPSYSVDTIQLEEKVDEYLKLDLSKYTRESVERCTGNYEQAKLLLEAVNSGSIDYSTQGEVDECVVKLGNSMDELEKKGITKEIVLLIISISCGVLFVVFLVLTIVMGSRSKKYKKLLEKERDDKTTAKEALKLSGRITPGDKLNRLSAGMPLNRSLATTTIDNQFVKSETTVLGMEELNLTSGLMSKIQNNAYIVRRRTGEEVLINKNNFVIGKDSEVVDYYISYNVNVSRKHAVINQIKGNYYIKDMGTTNGTYVNGFRLEKDKETMIQDGSVIVIADEEFEFRK